MSEAAATLESPVVAQIEYQARGKHFGQLWIPASTNTGGWTNICVPIVAIVGAEGPTALVIGGTHGDEPEGQVAALRVSSAQSAPSRRLVSVVAQEVDRKSVEEEEL